MNKLQDLDDYHCKASIESLLDCVRILSKNFYFAIPNTNGWVAPCFSHRTSELVDHHRTFNWKTNMHNCLDAWSMVWRQIWYNNLPVICLNDTRNQESWYKWSPSTSNGPKALLWSFNQRSCCGRGNYEAHFNQCVAFATVDTCHCTNNQFFPGIRQIQQSSQLN